MPLACDCYDGCWGDHSKGWPEIPYSEAAWRRCVQRLPYGSYVVKTDEEPRSERTWREWTGQPKQRGVIRLERESYIDRVSASAPA